MQEYKENSINFVYLYTKFHAEEDDIKFDITEDDVNATIFRNCYYCDAAPPIDLVAPDADNYDFECVPFNLIDRFDNDLGYVQGNIIPCCTYCDNVKTGLSMPEFREYVAKIYSKICLDQDEEKAVQVVKGKVWKYYDGEVILTDWMGNDLSVVNAARVSFNKRKTKFTEADAKLLKYLADHKHQSPFRHVQFCITLQGIPEFVLRQLFKHNVGISYTAGDFRQVDTVWNEVSGRYVEFDVDFFEPLTFRLQHETNKQASHKDKVVENQKEVREEYRRLINTAWEGYKKLLDMGVAKETARLVLPLSFKTSVIWTASLEALCHFVKLRDHEGAQVEIQTLAKIVAEIIQTVCPISYKVLTEA